MLSDVLSQTSHTQADVYNAIRNALLAKRPPVISLLDSASGFPPEGHSVVAYNVSGPTLGSPAGPQDFFIDVYDPNDEFVQAENSDLTGSTHQSNVMTTRIHVASDGWILNSTSDGSGNPFQGGIGGLIVTGAGSLPIQPTMIGVGSLGDIALLAFSSGASSPGTLRNRTTQVSDGSGHTLFDAYGNLNRDPATRLNATPFAPLLGATKPAEVIVIDGKTPRLEQTVVGLGESQDEHVLIAPGFLARLETQAMTGVVDEIDFDPAAGVSFKSITDRKPLNAEVAKRIDRQVKIAEIATTTFKGGREEFRFDPKYSSLVFHHAGPPSTYRLWLSAAGKATAPVGFDSGTLHIGANVLRRVGIPL